MIVVYVSDNPDKDTFKAVEVPSIEMARSVARGLAASKSAFVFRGLGWYFLRGGYGAELTHFRDPEQWGAWSWPEDYKKR